MTALRDDLLFVSCISRLEVARECLLASSCLAGGRRPLVMHWNSASAAHALNAVLDSKPSQRWVVWAHQDVRLPDGWDVSFLNALDDAELRLGALAVAGVYGVVGAGHGARRAGHVVDRGRLLREETVLPCVVDSLDELLFAVRSDTLLRLDPTLGFDFYATDLVLQAQSMGMQCAVLDACCEHLSNTPVTGQAPAALAQRIGASGAIFEVKWGDQLPVSTPCFDIYRPGDVKTQVDAWTAVSAGGCSNGAN